ncbi:MAG: transposase [Richelia sp.]|nr:transposase [Richelia sp.]CDN10157.1 Mobile element protein [Richelia intracellularis]
MPDDFTTFSTISQWFQRLIYPALMQRRLIMGYEDINDHEILRHDPIFALAVGKVINSEQELTTLAGKST